MKWLYAVQRLALRWNGSRCEPSRRAERRAGFVRRGPLVIDSGRPLRGLRGRSATTPTTKWARRRSVGMRLFPTGKWLISPSI